MNNTFTWGAVLGALCYSDALQHSAIHASTWVTYLCVISILGDRRVGRGLVEAYSEIESWGQKKKKRILGAVERKEQLGSFRINPEHVLNWVGPAPPRPCAQVLAPSPSRWMGS